MRLLLAIVALLRAAANAPVSAQATRTWVSGVGDDANPCSRTAPCKTFAGAISKTAAGGEINAIDPGGYGAVTITKSMIIDGSSQHASILSSGTNAVNINGAGIVVTLRNLAINGAGSGVHGINIINAASVTLENVVIDNVSGNGINLVSTGSVALGMNRVSIRRALGNGVLLKPGTGVTATATLHDLHLVGGGSGLRIEARGNATLAGSVISGNSNDGVLVVTADDAASLVISASRIVANGSGATTAGVHANGATASVRLRGNVISGNSAGLLSTGSGAIISHGENVIAGNTTDGAPTASAGTQ
jgi:hypothetical protein